MEDADINGAFIAGMTNESLVHELGCNSPRSTWKLFDIATNHTSGEEAVRAIFSKDKDNADREDRDEANKARREWNKKNPKCRDVKFVDAADRAGKQKTGQPDAGKNNYSFEKLMEGPCVNHGFPVKHLYQDCDIMKQYSRVSSRSPPRANEASPSRETRRRRRSQCWKYAS